MPPGKAPLRTLALGLLLALGGALLASAQNPPHVERSAPRATIALDIAWAHVTVEYGRPSTRGRAIFGQELPFDRVWRLGADEATRLTTTASLSIGGVEVPGGSYSLFVIPRSHTWTVIVNRIAHLWGAWNWNPAQDLGRVELAIETLETPIDTLTLNLAPQAEREKEGSLTIAWERSQITVPLRVLGDPPAPPPPPDTKAPPPH
ncbi:MAG: DUF2911 domain-containing protein [Acidobacteriota bacterium]